MEMKACDEPLCGNLQINGCYGVGALRRPETEDSKGLTQI